MVKLKKNQNSFAADLLRRKQALLPLSIKLSLLPLSKQLMTQRVLKSHWSNKSNIYTYIVRKTNNVPFQLLSIHQWPDGNSCTWPHDVIGYDGNRTKTYLFKKRVFTQWSIHVVDLSDICDVWEISKILFSVKWHKFIWRSQTLFRLEYSILRFRSRTKVIWNKKLNTPVLIIAGKVNSNYNMIPFFLPQFLWGFLKQVWNNRL